jgi:DNA gyrase subunit A
VNSRQLDMRVVVEIRRSGDPNFVREQLYTRTRLQVRVSVNLVGLIGREPKVLTLMDIMREFLEFRCESIERRARHELSKASSRLHVVEGYLAVQAAPDAVVAAIRAAKDGRRRRRRFKRRLSRCPRNSPRRSSRCR